MLSSQCRTAREKLLHVHVRHLDRLEQRHSEGRAVLAFLVVVAQGGNYPDPADQQLLVFLDDAGRYLSILDAQVAEKGLVTVLALIEPHGYPVDHLVGAALAHKRFNLLGLVRAHIVFGQHSLDVLQALLDDLSIIRCAVHPQQVFEHIDGDVSALLDQLCQVLSHHAPGKVFIEKLIQVFVLIGVHCVSCSQKKSSVKAKSMVIL
ncbi:hypothetical protein FQZ97_462940 [compost metagenome]